MREGEEGGQAWDPRTQADQAVKGYGTAVCTEGQAGTRVTGEGQTDQPAGGR